LLLDLNIPGRSPAEIGKWVRANFPKTITLVLTAQNQDIYLASLIDAGIAGMLSQDDSPEMLTEAIRVAAQGEIIFDDQQLDRAQQWRKVAGEKWAGLSNRQKQVLQLLAQGTSRKDVAAQLKIGPSAVEYHIGNLPESLMFKSLLEAVCWLHKYFPDDLRATIS
jgi:DNA-binding NarL/FixJ family response regulator